MPLPLIVLVGPTASGKSSLAIEVARRLRGDLAVEIVNADSMLVYRGMNIGTAKPSVAERSEVVHHLVDILDVDAETSVSQFQGLAREAIADCRARGVVPILVGGSALYVRAIVDNFDFPGTDPQVRQRYEDELARVGPEALHAELARRDPEAAAAILPGNGRRIVRALEVIELTGRFRATLPPWTYLLPGVHQFGLRLERTEMDARIDERVERMWQAGLVDEVRSLVRSGIKASKTASRGLGYQQVLAHLAGELTDVEARQATKDGTRRFARKQLMWWRRDPRITWLDAADPDNPERIARTIREWAAGCGVVAG